MIKQGEKTTIEELAEYISANFTKSLSADNNESRLCSKDIINVIDDAIKRGAGAKVGPVYRLYGQRYQYNGFSIVLAQYEPYNLRVVAASGRVNVRNIVPSTIGRIVAGDFGWRLLHKRKLRTYGKLYLLASQWTHNGVEIECETWPGREIAIVRVRGFIDNKVIESEV